jgi:hypothetical protein
MAEEVVATFAGPLDSFSINLTVDNAANSQVRTFGISGRTAKFPITWDSFGFASGPATVISTDGLDSEVVLVRFANVNSGQQESFNGIDPDFTGDISAGVRVLDISGARIMVLFGDGTTGFGEFETTDEGTLQAVATK